MKSLTIAIALATSAMLPLTADAVLLTASTDIPIHAPLIDFAQFAPAGRINVLVGDPPFEIDALPNEVVSVRPISSVFGNTAIILGDHTPPAHPDNNFYLGLNGSWGPSRQGFLGVSAGNGSIVTARIEFASGPVSAVGWLMNYAPQFPSVILTALDKNLSVIEQYEIHAHAPISTPGQFDAGAFRGIMRSKDEIVAIDITTAFAVIDDIRFFRTIPEPSTMAMAVFAIFALDWRPKRFQFQRSRSPTTQTSHSLGHGVGQAM